MSNILQLPSKNIPSYWQLVNEHGYEPKDVASLIESLEHKHSAALYYDWHFWRRPSQTPPEHDWSIWAFLGGRGTGKSWLGSNLTNEWAENYKRLALVGRTVADVRDVMIKGDSGLIATAKPWNKPVYKPTERMVVWPNGSFALIFSADEPDQLRGPQFEKVWCDEVAAWRKLKETLDNVFLCLRLGNNPQAVLTSTPRPIKYLKELLAKDTTYVSRDSTYSNLQNVAPQWASTIISRYKGTRLGLQELDGRVLDDNPDALWSIDTIDIHRVDETPKSLDRVTVAVDPPTKDYDTVADLDDLESAEAGIVVAGCVGKKDDPNADAWVLADYSIPQATPRMWAEKAIQAYYDYNADKIVGEANNGGALVKSNIQMIDPKIKVELVYASRGKRIRAQPVSTAYERGRVHHVGYFAELETQLTEWVPGDKSPDRLDALVWAITDLLGGQIKRSGRGTAATA